MIYFILFLFSLLLTYSIREYAVKKAILDIPNSRSSHNIATPKGGGLAIIIVFYIGVIYFKIELTQELFLALLCGIPIAIVSLVDDIMLLSSKVRLIVQSLSTLFALYFLGGISNIDFILFNLTGWWLNIIAFISIIWITNLYNFLDGIDGYAGTETVTIGIGIAIFLDNSLGLVIVVATLGFLLFNFPFKNKASIFMGDVGSATLGFIFAIFIFSDTSSGNIFIWLVLLSLFWVDATLTIIRRYRNKELITIAHKKHAYQRLNQSGWSHKKIVLFALLLNTIFLLLLLFDNLILIFIFNIVLLYLINKYIDKKKEFI